MSEFYAISEILLWVALSLPLGAWLSRCVFRHPPVNPAFDISSWFFLGLATDIFLLNAMQWWPWSIASTQALFVLAGINLVSLPGLWFCGRWSAPVNRAGNSEKKQSRVLVHWLSRIQSGLNGCSRYQLVLVAGGVAVVLLIFWLALKTASSAPLFGWDAWSGWVAKARIWHEHGLGTSIVPPRQWLLLPSQAQSYSSHMWHYPDAIGLLYAVSAPLSDSVEHAAASLWPLLTFFLGLGMAGLLWESISLNVCAKVLLSLLLFALFILTPLWNMHIALPGYADIVLAAFLWQAVAHLYLAIRLSQRSFYLSAGLFLVVLPFIKLFGWIMAGVVGAAYALVYPKSRWVFFQALGVFFLLMVLIGFLLPIELHTQAGPLVLRSDYFVLPGYGRIELGWHFAGRAWFEGVFFSQNWLFFWFPLPVIIFVGLRCACQRPSLAFLVHVLVLYLLCIISLYSLTSFNQFAMTFTSSNRMLLHVYPVYLFVFFLILAGGCRVSGISTDSMGTKPINK